MTLSQLLRLGFMALAFAAVGGAHAFAQAPVKVKMRLDWKGGAQHAPFYLGQQRGFYKQEGIDLEVISGSGSSDTIKQIGSKAVEFGLVDALVLVQGVQQRVPAKSLAAYYQRTPIVLISPKAKPVTDPRQLLEGIRLGSKKGSATFQGLVALLSANGMQLEQIKLVDIGFGVQPLLVKQVDAIMGFSMNEPIEAESAGMPVTLMPISNYGVKTYGLTIASNPDFMQQKPEVVKGFMKATVRSVAETMKDSGRSRCGGCDRRRRDRHQARGQGAGAHDPLLAEQRNGSPGLRLADRAGLARHHRRCEEGRADRDGAACGGRVRKHLSQQINGALCPLSPSACERWGGPAPMRQGGALAFATVAQSAPPPTPLPAAALHSQGREPRHLDPARPLG